MLSLSVMILSISPSFKSSLPSCFMCTWVAMCLVTFKSCIRNRYILQWSLWVGEKYPEMCILPTLTVSVHHFKILMIICSICK
jgi:hypothetical protein